MVQELLQPIRGIVPPMVTPLTDQGGLDRAGLERLIEHQIDGGVHGLFILGTTGEGPSLSYDIRREVIRQTSRIVDGRIPVLVGITDAALVESIALSKVAADAGCDAVVAAPPFYYPIAQHELHAYFRRLLDEAPLPTMLYNMPAVTGLTIEVETVRQLLDHRNLVGLKDSSGDLEYFQRLVAATTSRPDFSLMVGAEHLLGPALSLGAAGGVPGGANIWPCPYVRLYEAAFATEPTQLARATDDIARLGAVYSVGPESIPATIARIKSALSKLEICGDVTAAPLGAVDEMEGVRIQNILQKLGVRRSEPTATTACGRVVDANPEKPPFATSNCPA